MSAPKHTPRPLQAVNMAVMDRINQTVATCHYPFFSSLNNLNRDPAETARANAKLFAAAPDLLEACKDAAKLIMTARQYFPKSIHNTDTFALENTCAAINKAIAKAEEAR